MNTAKNPNVPYSETAQEKYAALTKAMPVPAELTEWVGLMKSKYGESMRLHQSMYSNWLTALLIVRYGEAESFWPTEFSEDDIQRAAAWYHGRKPEGVHYQGGAHATRSILKMGMGLLAGIVAMWFLDPLMGLFALPFLVGAALTDSAENDMIAGFYRTGLTTIADWATVAYVVGDVVQPATWNDRLYRCVVAGTSSGAEPAFSTVIGTETTDSGGVVWQTCAVGPLKVPIFWALFTAAPGETGGGTEVTGGAYSRTAFQPLDANYDAPAGGTGQTANTLEITFPAPSGANWGTVVSFASMDRLTGVATMFSYASLTSSEIINDGDQAPKFSVGALTATWA